MAVHFEVHQERVIGELDRLARGPLGEEVGRLEAVMLRYFAQTQAIVHVITGQLKSTGHTESSFDGGTWTGTAVYARHPGIFELARGNHPTINHPEGGHYFFEPYGDSEHAYEAAVIAFLEG